MKTLSELVKTHMDLLVQGGASHSELLDSAVSFAAYAGRLQDAKTIEFLSKGSYFRKRDAPAPVQTTSEPRITTGRTPKQSAVEDSLFYRVHSGSYKDVAGRVSNRAVASALTTAVDSESVYEFARQGKRREFAVTGDTLCSYFSSTSFELEGEPYVMVRIADAGLSLGQSIKLGKSANKGRTLRIGPRHKKRYLVAISDLEHFGFPKKKVPKKVGR